MEKDEALKLIAGQEYMTLATSDKLGKPEAATIKYVASGDELLFNTQNTYRKYQNLSTNPLVACVITNAKDWTIQIDGRVVELSGKELETAQAKMAKADPDYLKYFELSSTAAFKIELTWVRVRDYRNGGVEEHVIGW